MITVGMNYHVIPGKQKDFEDKFAAVMGALNAAAGHTSSTLWKDVADDASSWSDEQALRSHSKSLRDVTIGAEEQMAGRNTRCLQTLNSSASNRRIVRALPIATCSR